MAAVLGNFIFDATVRAPVFDVIKVSHELDHAFKFAARVDYLEGESPRHFCVGILQDDIEEAWLSYSLIEVAFSCKKSCAAKVVHDRFESFSLVSDVTLFCHLNNLWLDATISNSLHQRGTLRSSVD